MDSIGLSEQTVTESEKKALITLNDIMKNFASATVIVLEQKADRNSHLGREQASLTSAHLHGNTSHDYNSVYVPHPTMTCFNKSVELIQDSNPNNYLIQLQTEASDRIKDN